MTMPDISMCSNDNCKNNNECFRFRAKPNEYRQAYTIWHIENDGTDCAGFTSIAGWSGYSLQPIKEANNE